MKVFSIEFGLVLCALYLCWFMYKQSEEIAHLEDTINIQNEAIHKQNFLISLQTSLIKRSHSEDSYDPIIYQ